jgi:ABC-type amino acid transport substrate-binding protein
MPSTPAVELAMSDPRPRLRPRRRPQALPPIPVLVLVLAAASVACDGRPEHGDAPSTTPAAGIRAETERPAAGPVVAPSFAEARESGQAALTFYYVPSSGFAYHDPEGRLTGVTVELLRDFARYVVDAYWIDLDIRWLAEARWADFYQYVRDSEGGAFGIGNVTITEDRREELDFSPPYLSNVAVLVTHLEIPELGSMDEIPEVFRGLAALPYPGTLHEQRLDAIRERWLPDAPAHPVSSNDELVSILGADPGYFGYMDVYNYWRAREAGQPLRRHPVGDDASETFGVILPRGSDWTPIITEFFQANGDYAQSERFRGLLRTHLGDPLAALLEGGE